MFPMEQILSDTKWDDGGLVRAKQFHQAQYRAMERSLEKAAASKVMRRLLGDDFRFQEPNELQVPISLADLVDDASGT